MRPEVAAVRKEIGNGALIKLGEPGQDIKRGLVTALAGPLLPVREILERLRVIRPSLRPLICGPLLCPAMSQAQRRAGIDAKALAEHRGDLRPWLPGAAERLREPELLLPDTADLRGHNCLPSPRVRT